MLREASFLKAFSIDERAFMSQNIPREYPRKLLKRYEQNVQAMGNKSLKVEANEMEVIAENFRESSVKHVPS